MVITTRKLQTKISSVLPSASRSPNKFKKPSLIPNKKRVLRSSVSYDNMSTNKVQLENNISKPIKEEEKDPEPKKPRFSRIKNPTCTFPKSKNNNNHITHLLPPSTNNNNNNNSKTTVIRNSRKLSSPKTPKSNLHKPKLKSAPPKSKNSKNSTKHSNKSSASSTATTASISYFNNSTTNDFIHSFVPDFKPVSLNDFYSGELDEILRDQSAFILDAQEYQRTKGNQYSSSDLNNAENTRLLELLKKQPLPIKTRRTAEYTIVLDLDETLVHASLQPPTDGIHDFEFEVVIADGTTYTVYVKLRPGLNEFLERMSATYELVLFTASKQIYAEKLTSMLDPEKKCIKHRLYRDHCRQIMLNYVKDLTVMGRDLRKTIIIDNSPQAFAYQVENGIPIKSWFGDDYTDRELERVADICENLIEQNKTSPDQDIRKLITQQFGVQERLNKYRFDKEVTMEYLDGMVPPEPGIE